jgi:hypothetical protein
MHKPYDTSLTHTVKLPRLWGSVSPAEAIGRLLDRVTGPELTQPLRSSELVR